MKAKADRGTYLAVAKLAMQIADREIAALDEIEHDLDAGKDREALEGLKRFFRERKPVNREQRSYDRQDSKARA